MQSTGVLGKRPAADNDDDSRFVKRLNLLSLGGSGSTSSSTYYVPVNDPAASKAKASSAASRPNPDEHMQLDDTPDRVYIHNIDDELAEIQDEEEKLIFLPDIEKYFSKLPERVMRQKDEDHENQEMVLYGVPKSLSFDEDHDSVRKAMIETRKRARDKAIQEARLEDMNRRYEQSAENDEPVETAHGYGGGYTDDEEPDPDEMDMS